MTIANPYEALSGVEILEKSSDTADEIVYEEKIDIATLSQMVIELIKYLKDVVFVSKEEQIIGETPWGYDKVKNMKLR